MRAIWVCDRMISAARRLDRYTPATGDLTAATWTQDPDPFVDGSAYGDAGSQSFVPLPRVVDGTTLPSGAPTHMISSGGALRLGVYNQTSETFTSSLGRDGTPISSGLDAGKFGWMITNRAADGRTLTFGWLAATCGNCKPQVAPQVRSRSSSTVRMYAATHFLC
jgi:hypothetical protein